MLDDEMVKRFQEEFAGRYETMKPIDIATFYYCFTKIGFKGEGIFYKYIQKSLTKTIRAFEGPEIRMMFYKFDEVESTRLNRGVRGRLIDHFRYLLNEEKISGFDANEVYTHTKRLEWEPTKVYSPVISVEEPNVNLKPKTNKKFIHHDLHTQCRSYLEKLKYFN